jgi:hypothetical protein
MRIVTPADAVAGIGSGDQVYVHCAAAAPSVVLDALERLLNRIRSAVAEPMRSVSRAR